MKLFRLWLLRRRLDPMILALAFAGVASMTAAGKAGFVFFAACGFYLVVVGHRARRLLPPLYSALLLAYVVWTLGMIAWHGEPFGDNRQLGYSAVQLAALFIPVGLCLVPRPVDAMVAGCRVGTVLLFLAAPVEFFWFGSERVGLGGNAAILAFLAAAAAIAARIDMVRAPRWLPNGRGWTYLALAPLLLSQTRAAWLVFALVAAVDVFSLLHGASRRKAALSMGAAGAAIAVLGFVAAPIIAERVNVVSLELDRFEESGEATGSTDVRLVFWRGGWEVMRAHPLFGVGAGERMERVAAVAGENAPAVLEYEHLHNVFLDEALASGLVGLALMLALFASFLVAVWRRGDVALAITATLFQFLVFSFGSFHGVLVNEWMIVMVFGFNAVVLSSLRRGELARVGHRYGRSA